MLGGAIGSLGPAVVGVLHSMYPDRVLVVVTESPRDAVSVETDLETLLERDEASHMYPQKEALPYEESETHVEIGGLRVEAHAAEGHHAAIGTIVYVDDADRDWALTTWASLTR